jgi:pimeloyl-ACP methyl ester carboxylesterase
LHTLEHGAIISRMARRFTRVPVLLVAVLMGCGGAERGADDAEPRPTLVGVGSGDLVDVGGRQLYVECAGSGSPTVVLEAGFGNSSRTWSLVQPELGGTTRTCTYDRAGLGESEPMPGLHDAGDEIRDLERLLERGRIEPPYVLVGHSYGGLLARLYAHAHPDETVGVVLVDANGRDEWQRVLAAWPRTFAPKLRRRLIREPPIGGVDSRASAALDRDIRSLGDTPLIVITAAHSRELHPEVPRAVFNRGLPLRRAMQAELATLSPDRAHVMALRSDHVVQDDQPDVVTQAVQAVVAAARDNATLPPCREIFTGPEVRCLS